MLTKTKPVLKIFVSILVFSLVAYTLNNSFTQSNKSQQEYVVGVVTSLSGPGSSLGQPWVQGMQLAVDEINNQGGVNGNNIKLVVEDDSMNTGKSATAANFLIDTQRPDILTSLFHISTIAMNPMSQRSQTPLISASFATPHTVSLTF